MTVVPVKLPPNPIRHFYRGGPAIAELRGIDVGGDHSPEEWIGSAATLFGESERGLSRLPDGTLVRDALAADPEAWLGAGHVARFGANPALLVKLLDAGERLPVHHHPDRAFAREHLGLDFGKTEAWLVIAARAGRAGQRRLARGRGRADARARGSPSRTTTRCSARCNPRRGQRGRRDLRPCRRRRTRSATGSSSSSCRSRPTSRSCSSGTASGSRREAQATLGLGWERALGSVERSARDAQALRGPRADGARRRAAPRRPPRPSSAPSASRRAAARCTLPAGFAVVLVVDGAGTLAGLDVTRGDALLVPHAAGPVSADGDLVAIVCRPPETT